jgi:cytochrome c-type biogenesis protein CcmH/NrfF
MFDILCPPALILMCFLYFYQGIRVKSLEDKLKIQKLEFEKRILELENELRCLSGKQ